MPTLQFIHMFETITQYAIKAYAIGGELLSVSLILFSLNFIASLVEKTYNTGVIVGRFYFGHLHKPLTFATRKLIAFTKWAGLRLLVLLVLGSVLLAERSYTLWVNRQEVISQLNNLRNHIGGYFIYRSPAPALVIANN